MPNWCENTLTITGTAEAVLAFRRANASDKLELDFERSVVRINLCPPNSTADLTPRAAAPRRSLSLRTGATNRSTAL